MAQQGDHQSNILRRFVCRLAAASLLPMRHDIIVKVNHRNTCNLNLVMVESGKFVDVRASISGPTATCFACAGWGMHAYRGGCMHALENLQLAAGQGQ